mmetsp:Transcript_28758/g.71776  ORF Transcript_28758/g.71776 Transcript_28758/m.71776 type:complete len:223 (+) Transcript_28758:146-814(+)
MRVAHSFISVKIADDRRLHGCVRGVAVVSNDAVRSNKAECGRLSGVEGREVELVPLQHLPLDVPRQLEINAALLRLKRRLELLLDRIQNGAHPTNALNHRHEGGPAGAEDQQHLQLLARPLVFGPLGVAAVARRGGRLRMVGARVAVGPTAPCRSCPRARGRDGRGGLRLGGGVVAAGLVVLGLQLHAQLEQVVQHTGHLYLVLLDGVWEADRRDVAGAAKP